MLKSIAAFLIALAAVLCQHPKDFEYYHILHLPHDPPLYPVYERAPPTSFSCQGRSRGYYADVDSGCQAYHFCWRQHLVSTDLCTNGTLFNEQFQVCDHFYNVRCGSPYKDL
ncbi:U-scoloptoxin(01)-Cw1a-like [Maniola jurtina]|uniref:U-scoloptoxin(01)-Cw1a-like n=1 Tax=Maniola jurtina TaxID=191418 RepID=UPI001E686AC9|nr:U-scoloptoxin(01)-Cw1a-like [Maniola jurtina]